MTLPNLPYIGDEIPNNPFTFPEEPATFDRLFGSLVPNIQLEPNPSLAEGKWIRPADWLPMPEIAPTEEKFVALFAVYDTPLNPIAVYFEGDFTVDWGDGTVEDFASGTKAQHSFNWSDIPSSTLTSEGYRQVLVTVTPQAGQQLTKMDLSVRHDYIHTNWNRSSPFLDIVVSMPNAGSGTSMVFGYYGGVSSAYSPCLLKVERIHIVHAGAMSNFNDYFYYFLSLRSVQIDHSPNADNFRGMFDYCTALKDGASDIILSDTSTVTNTEYMFGDCYSLQTVSLFDTSSVESAYDMFYNCSSLRTVPAYDFASATDISWLFESCRSLVSVENINTPAAVYTNGMFYECYSLSEVPEFDTSAVQIMNNMFEGCAALKTIPNFNTVSVTSMSYMLDGCTALVEIPELNTSNVQIMPGMFNFCPSLAKVPALDTSSVTNMAYIFSSCNVLESAPLSGTKVDISYYGCLLGRDAIVDIFNNLDTASATIYVDGNYGAADLTTDDVNIAVDKGWTVIY